MKPSWDGAPEWANYLAMDSDGGWYWYQCKPERGSYDVWVYKKVGKVALASTRTNTKDDFSVWHETLEKRPAAEGRYFLGGFWCNVRDEMRTVAERISVGECVAFLMGAFLAMLIF